MASNSCEIFSVKREGKLRWTWRHTPADGRAVVCSNEEYPLFYECLSAARERGFTPTYGGMRLFQQGDAIGLAPHASIAAKHR
jgi:hypothetical protein